MAEVNQESQKNVNGATASPTPNAQNSAQLNDSKKEEAKTPSLGGAPAKESSSAAKTPGSGEKVTMPKSANACAKKPISGFKRFIYAVVYGFSYLLEKIGLGLFAIGLYLLEKEVDYASLGLVAEGIVMMALAIWNMHVIKKRRNQA